MHPPVHAHRRVLGIPSTLLCSWTGACSQGFGKGRHALPLGFAHTSFLMWGWPMMLLYQFYRGKIDITCIIGHLPGSLPDPNLFESYSYYLWCTSSAMSPEPSDSSMQRLRWTRRFRPIYSLIRWISGILVSLLLKRRFTITYLFATYLSSF